MQKLNPHNRRIGTTALAATVSGLSLAAAMLVPNYYVRADVHDFDQERTGLPGQGAMYCVPTSYVDAMKYMAANGLPGMDSTYGNTNTSVTNFIEHLGELMDTDEEDGTNLEDSYDAMTDWVSDHTGVIVFNSLYGPGWNWGTGTIKNLLTAGAMTRVGYGRYYKIGNSWTRAGGHSVILPGYHFKSDVKYFFVADPATTFNDPGGIHAQSEFNYNVKETENITLTTADYGVRTHARYDVPVAASGGIPALRRVIDSMHTITPNWAGWWETDIYLSKKEGAAGDGSVKTIMPFQLNGTEFEPRDVRARGEIVDWIYDLGSAAVFYVTKLGKIYYADLTTGDDKLIHVVKGASALMVGGTTNDLFVLVKGESFDSVTCFERDDMHIEQDQVPDRLRKTSRALPGHGLAIEFDPISGGPSVLSDDLSVAWAFDDQLAPQENLNLPPLGSGTGKVIFKIDHLTGDVLMARSGDLAYWRKQRRGETVRHSPRLTSGISALIPTEGHRLLIQDGDTLQTFDRGGNLTETQFSNVVVGGPVKMVRSTFAAKRGTLNGPKWRDLRPSELGN